MLLSLPLSLLSSSLSTPRRHKSREICFIVILCIFWCLKKLFTLCRMCCFFSSIFLSLSISICMHCALFYIIVFWSQNILNLEPVYFTYDAGFNNSCHSRMPSYFLWALYAAADFFFYFFGLYLEFMQVAVAAAVMRFILSIVWAVPNDARKCMCKVYFLSHTTITRHLSYLWNSMLLLL